MTKKTIEDILAAKNNNLAGDVEDIANIGAAAVEEYLNDAQDKRYKSKKRCWDEGQKLVQLTEEAKSFPFHNASNVKYPLLTNAAVQFSSRAYPSIVQGNSVVRPKITGYDPFAEEKRAIEEEIEQIRRYEQLDLEMLENISMVQRYFKRQTKVKNN